LALADADSTRKGMPQMKDSTARAGTPAKHAAIATVLAAVAGFVDTAGFLTLAHVYTANMSGNTVQVGVEALGDTGGSPILHAYTVGMFLFGLFASGIMIEIGLRRGFRCIFAATMMLEVICLGIVVAAGDLLLEAGAPRGWPLYSMIALFTIAMAAQNTSLRMAGVLTVYTTHVTGTITKFSEDAVRYVFALIDRRRENTQPAAGEGRPAPPFAAILLSAGLCGGFVVGAVLAGFLVPPIGLVTLLIPIAVVTAIGIVDYVQPLASRTG
jgi:uncharacterized membrane protein YoaK (UPF0700 family)